jgi:hypothetical protein
MSLYHPKRYKVSFVKADEADIRLNRVLQEPKMSTYTHESMINHHEPGILSQIGENPPCLAAALSGRAANWRSGPDRELHDVGISWSDVAYEAEKPFWRA